MKGKRRRASASGESNATAEILLQRSPVEANRRELLKAQERGAFMQQLICHYLGRPHKGMLSRNAAKGRASLLQCSL